MIILSTELIVPGIGTRSVDESKSRPNCC